MAQVAYTTVSSENDTNYEVVKKAVLRAFELVPEAISNFKIKGRQTYGSLSRVSEVYTFKELRQLMLLESSVPRQLEVHFNEQLMQSASKAAELSDNCVDTQRSVAREVLCCSFAPCW